MTIKNEKPKTTKNLTPKIVEVSSDVQDVKTADQGLGRCPVK